MVPFDSGNDRNVRPFAGQSGRRPRPEIIRRPSSAPHSLNTRGDRGVARHRDHPEARTCAAVNGGRYGSWGNRLTETSVGKWRLGWFRKKQKIHFWHGGVGFYSDMGKGFFHQSNFPIQSSVCHGFRRAGMARCSRPFVPGRQSNTIVLFWLTRIWSSTCSRTALASTTRSRSRPLRTRSPTLSRCPTGSVACAMIGPWSSSSVM